MKKLLPLLLFSFLSLGAAFPQLLAPNAFESNPFPNHDLLPWLEPHLVTSQAGCSARPHWEESLETAFRVHRAVAISS